MRLVACLLAVMLAACSSSKLPKPENLQASQGSYADRIELSWNAVDGAETYRIFRFQTQTGAYQPIDYVDAQYTATENSVDSPEEYPIVVGEHYFYKGAAVDADDNRGDLSERAEGWAESTVPADFEVHLWWTKGSGAPYAGVLTNYTVDISPDLQGVVSFHYYEADDRSEDFAVTDQQWVNLYSLMLEHDIFRDEWSENPRPPTGGATESISLLVNGETFGPPIYPGTADEIADKAAALQAVRDLVPESVWD